MSFVDDLVRMSSFNTIDTNFFGGEDPYVQGYAQSPGQSWLQGALKPLLNQGITAGTSGQGLYPIAQYPDVGSYNVPSAPFNSVEDFSKGYGTIMGNLLEPYGSSLGSAQGGWSGAGTQALGNAMAQLTPQIMTNYTNALLPYQQMAAQRNQNVWNMQNLGQFQQAGAQQQSYAAPWNLANLFSGTYGSPIINQGSEGFGGTLGTIAAMGMFL